MNTKHSTLLGGLCGILGAICYGTNPIGANTLTQDGFVTPNILLFRFGIAVMLVAVYMLLRGISFRLKRREAAITLLLGLLFAGSSLSLYCSFRHMSSGIASTILFVYPIMTAAIMFTFFGEKLRWHTVVSMLLAIGGIAVLSIGGQQADVNALGVCLVLTSALTYAIYMVVINRLPLTMPLIAISFWVMLFCLGGILLYAVLAGQFHELKLPDSLSQWEHAAFLGIVPSLLSITFTTVSIQHIGSTSTAILGALEPVTAVCLCTIFLEEALTGRLLAGIVLILAAVIILLLKQSSTAKSNA